MKHSLRLLKKQASALVITLLIVTLMAVIAVAFMQTMSLARTTAKSYSDIRQATLAAEAGIDMAVAQLLLAAGTNRAFVTGLTNYPNTNFPLTVIGQTNLTNANQLMPLVSGPTNLLAGFGSPAWANFGAYAEERTKKDVQVAVDLNSGQLLQQTNVSGYADGLYRAAWVVLTNVVGNTTNYSRFAYVVTDEHARINPVLHTGEGKGMAGDSSAGFTNAFNWYEGPQDIALTNAPLPLLSAAQADAIKAQPQAYGTSRETFAQAFASRADWEKVRHLFTAQANPTFDVIPAWLPDGGKAKYNINDLATNSVYGATAEDRAKNIATIIGRNLPDFYKRDPALRATNSTTYLNRLAANIVDYIDEDDVFTQVNGESSGMEAAVFPVAIAERINALKGGYNDLSSLSAQAEAQFFVSVWNPYNFPVTINAAELTISNRPPYVFSDAILMYPPDYMGSITGPLVAGPNEFLVLEFPTQMLPEMNANTPSTTGLYSTEAKNEEYLQYELKINGQIVARSAGLKSGRVALGGGLDHDDTTYTPSGGSKRSRIGNGVNAWVVTFLQGSATVMDGRFDNFCHTVWFGTVASDNYRDDTFWKGRWGRQDTANDQTYYDLKQRWRYRDYVPRSTTKGSAPGSLDKLPSAVTSKYSAADALNAPTVLRNGPMRSLGELGHIFDPVHASDSLDDSQPTGSGKFSFKSPYQNGGGRSLRLGQPEFQGVGANTWATNGRRAIDLLDLFTVNSTNAVTGGALGRINPNTAPVEVLSATLSGIKVLSDEGQATQIRSLVNPTNWANMVISNRPYACLSDLSKLLPTFYNYRAYNPAFSSYTLDGSNHPAALDRAREEAFGKWVQHLSVQSCTYRIYVAGQVLDFSFKPRGTVLMEAVVTLQFDEASNRFHPVIQYARTIN